MCSHNRVANFFSHSFTPILLTQKCWLLWRKMFKVVHCWNGLDEIHVRSLPWGFLQIFWHVLRIMVKWYMQWNHKVFIQNRPTYIGKNQNSKNLGFCVPFTLPEKPQLFRFFGKKSACAKNPESHCFWGTCKWCACMTSRCLWLHVVRSTPRAEGHIITSHVTKTRIIPARGERAFTLAKKVRNRWGFKKLHFGFWVFYSVFL